MSQFDPDGRDFDQILEDMWKDITNRASKEEIKRTLLIAYSMGVGNAMRAVGRWPARSTETRDSPADTESK